MYNTTLATADLVKLCNYNNFKEKKILKTVFDHCQDALT